MMLTGGNAFKGHMGAALEAARAAAKRGEVPVGAAVVAPDGELLVSAGNRVRELKDPTAHAEMLALKAACNLAGNERLVGHSLFVTLEPCPMCAFAISLARISRLYYGASDPKGGGIESGPRIYQHAQSNHIPEIYDGIEEAACGGLLTGFFKGLRHR